MCLIEALTVGFTDQHFGPDQSRPYAAAAAAATKVVDGWQLKVQLYEQQKFERLTVETQRSVRDP